MAEMKIIIRGFKEVITQVVMLTTIIDLCVIDTAMSMTEDLCTMMVTRAKETLPFYVTVYSICSVPRHCEQHCHVAMYQFQDIDTLFDVICPKE